MASVTLHSAQTERRIMPRPEKRARLLSFACMMFFLAAGYLPSVNAQKTPLPPVPFEYGLGHTGFTQNCAGCHGGNLEGSQSGPPLLHGYYHPGHHSDVAFYRAITRGVQQHHWNFGNMPAVETLSPNEAEAIIRFIRWAQQEMGLY